MFAVILQQILMKQNIYVSTFHINVRDFYLSFYYFVHSIKVKNKSWNPSSKKAIGFIPFKASTAFQYPLKTSENHKVHSLVVPKSNEIQY